MGKGLDRHFSKDIQKGQQAHIKALKIIRKMQIRTTMRYHYTSPRMAIIIFNQK